MGLLNALGLSSPSEEKAEQRPITLHPGAAAHQGVMVAWLQGAKVEVLNPNTNAWEDCDNPIFDPEIAYRLAQAPVNALQPLTQSAGAAIWAGEPKKVMGQHSPFNRGDIWRASNGFTYIVLVDKANCIDGYDASVDPDGAPIVVMRFDAGKKPAVSHRDVNGNRRDGNSGFRLVEKLDSHAMTSISIDGTVALIQSRYDRADVRLNMLTGETLCS